LNAARTVGPYCDASIDRAQSACLSTGMRSSRDARCQLKASRASGRVTNDHLQLVQGPALVAFRKAT
jgi:hypothetical protein